MGSINQFTTRVCKLFCNLNGCRVCGSLVSKLHYAFVGFKVLHGMLNNTKMTVVCTHITYIMGMNLLMCV